MKKHINVKAHKCEETHKCEGTHKCEETHKCEGAHKCEETHKCEGTLCAMNCLIVTLIDRKSIVVWKLSSRTQYRFN